MSGETLNVRLLTRHANFAQLAIGIMRCAAYSAAKGRPLLEKGNPDDAISHFHDKLLKLRGMMRTTKGKSLARARHETMLAFLRSNEEEEGEEAEEA